MRVLKINDILYRKWRRVRVKKITPDYAIITNDTKINIYPKSPGIYVEIDGDEFEYQLETEELKNRYEQRRYTLILKDRMERLFDIVGENFIIHNKDSIDFLINTIDELTEGLIEVLKAQVIYEENEI